MGNGKSEIPGTLEPWNSGTLELWNSGTLELWNSGTLECVTIVLNPLRGKDWVWIIKSIVLHPLRGKSVNA